MRKHPHDPLFLLSVNHFRAKQMIFEQAFDDISFNTSVGMLSGKRLSMSSIMF